MQNDVCLAFMCLIAAVHMREREKEIFLSKTE